MSKKKDKKKLAFEIDKNTNLFEIYLAKSRDGMIIGNTIEKGNHYTVLPDKEYKDITVHKTKIQPDGSKKYPEQKRIKNFMEAFLDNIIICESIEEIIKLLSKNSIFFPITNEDFEINNYVEDDGNNVRFNFTDFILEIYRKFMKFEKVEKDKLELYLKKHPKGFTIADVDNKKLYLIEVRENKFYVVDASAIGNGSTPFSNLVPKISDDKIEILKKKIEDIEDIIEPNKKNNSETN